MTGNQPSYFQYWGKADPNYPGEPKWHPLAYHCLDVAAVGSEYLHRAPSVRALLMRGLRIEKETTTEDWLVFWLALHDLGKFSEAFQSQRPDLFLARRGRLPNPSKSYRLRHDSLGMLFWKDVLGPKAVEEEWLCSPRAWG